MAKERLRGEMRDIEIFLSRPADPFSAPVHTLQFERSLASFFGVEEAVAVSSGTAAIHCALAALDIREGDEVLVPSLAVVMSAVPVLYQNAKPVFVDCQPEHIDFDYEDLERKVTSKSRAILPVYLWGYSYDVTRLIDFAKKHRLGIIEDACQAHGALWKERYLGTWGTLGCFSMREGKLLSTGEGGFVLTNDAILADRCRAFRSHWANPDEPDLSYSRLGNNYRITELQAILARRQLGHLKEILSHRQWQAEFIRNSLGSFRLLQPYEYDHDNEQPNFYSPLFLLKESLGDRKVAKKLSEMGVKNSVGTFGLKPLQSWKVFDRDANTADLSVLTPNASRFLDRSIAISLLTHYAEPELNRIVETLRTAVEQSSKESNHE